MRATYLLLDLGFIAGIVGIWYATNRRDWSLRQIIIVLGGILFLTLGFDSFLTALPIIVYTSTRISGIHIGSIPIEDFGYAIAAPFIVMVAWRLSEGRKR
jgi:lycopene cyclase domain-containing protein